MKTKQLAWAGNNDNINCCGFGALPACLSAAVARSSLHHHLPLPEAAGKHICITRSCVELPTHSRPSLSPGLSVCLSLSCPHSKSSLLLSSSPNKHLALDLLCMAWWSLIGSPWQDSPKVPSSKLHPNSNPFCGNLLHITLQGRHRHNAIFKTNQPTLFFRL